MQAFILAFMASCYPFTLQPSGMCHLSLSAEMRLNGPGHQVRGLSPSYLLMKGGCMCSGLTWGLKSDDLVLSTDSAIPSWLELMLVTN